jgi:general secretion pathway protein D
MFNFNRITATIATALLLVPMLPLEARTKKGDKFLGEGRVQEEKRQWDAALENYEKALSEDPGEIVYQMAAEKARFQAAQNHINLGIKVRAKGLLGEALLEFQKAYNTNPSSSAAVQEIGRTQEMILRERRRVEETGREAPPEQRGLTPAEEVKKQTQDKIDRILPAPELKPLNPEPLKNLTIHNQTAKVLFETVAKVANINVLWDPEYQPPSRNSFNVDFENTTVDQALDNIAIITKSFWKPMSPNTIFITNDNPNKRRDYAEMVAQTFYLSNVASAQEIQEIVNAVRSIAEVQRVVAFTSQNAIIVRGEADQVALAAKMIHDLDKPRAEVVVDILVMEASSVFKRQVTAAIASTGLNIPISFTPRTGLSVVTNPGTSTTTGTTGSSTTGTTGSSTTGTTGTDTSGTTGTGTTGTTGSSTATFGVPLSNLHYLNGSDFAVALPSALLQAALSDTKTKVLQAPQLRMVDNVKAELKIGERQPTATGSFQPGIGGVGINPLVNTQFNFIDVGVNVTMQSHVHDNGDVSMHIDLDISTVSGHVNLGGIDQPIIGQRKISHDIRMHEGEINLLGGLTNLQESKQVTGIPGLSSIPLLRRLFSGETVDKERDELMIVIVPHIVRSPDVTAQNLRGIAVGNQQTIKLSYSPKPADVVSGPAAAAVLGNPNSPTPSAMPPAPPATGNPPVTAPAVNPPQTAPAAVAGPAPGVPPGMPPGIVPGMPPGVPSAANPGMTTPATATSPPATAPPVTGPPMTAPPATAPPAADQPSTTPPAGNARVMFSPAQMETRVGAPINVGVVLDNGTDVASAPLTIRYDPKVLKLNTVLRGDFLASDGQQPVFSTNILQESGIATVQLNRQPGTPGVNGGGVLVTLQFQAVGRGSTAINLQGLTVRNSQGLPIATGAPQMQVNVQ